MTDLAFRPATELAAAIRQRRMSSRELLELYLQRIERFNPGLNAVVTLDREGARQRADAADATLSRGEHLGPLHGVPVTIKDTLETAGMRTTAGFPPLAEHVPARDAVAVARLRAAGAVILGKTNVPLLADDWQSYNPIFGTTANPWDPARTPGGSSGGAAAALAAGLSALEVGSDIGGSIRVPADWCGVYGHKPTHGIVPARGHIPGPPGTLSEADLAVVGPLGRSADDLALALELLAGPLPDRAIAWDLQLPPPRRASLGEYRIAAWLDDPAYPVDREVRAALEAAVEALRKAGGQVHDGARPRFGLADAVRTYQRLLSPIVLAGFPSKDFERFLALARELREDDESPQARLLRFGTQRHREWLSASEERERYRARWADFFVDWDVLLCPVSPVPAILHDHREPQMSRTILVNGQERPYDDLLAWAGLATMPLLPATVAPVGRTPGGLPVGIQIVGPYLEDRTTIDVARRLADVVGGFEPPPGY